MISLVLNLFCFFPKNKRCNKVLLSHTGNPFVSLLSDIPQTVNYTNLE